MADMITMLNKIRQEATSDYQARIPLANRNNLESIRFAMIDGDNVMVANEFMSSILNKLVKSVVHHKRFTNPLKSLKKGKKPIGDTIEEIYNNFLKGTAYNNDSGATLMERSLPDTKTVYHRMNYQLQYPVTVGREELSRAFMSYDALESFIQNIIDQLYNSAELDEFANIKNLLKSAIVKKAVVEIDVADPLTDGQEFIKQVKTTSGLMAFPSTQFNGYLTAQSTDTKPITTFSRKNEQILILDTATDVSVNVDVLASLFNMSVAEFNDTRKIVIDTFMDDESDTHVTAGMLIDEQFIQLYDDLFTVTSWYNPKSLYTNYYLNVWQTQAYSILVNAVRFRKAKA